ncbi:hypothetical protein [Microvirga sp. TS319]|uniref:hypothetical protein n=1 Tax=Microvirga sp. TS319 TaxID=3241165 RepID=UPI00351A105A
MANVPYQLLTHAAYGARLVHTARETVWRSRRLLEQTEPLVAAIKGGSVIGMRVLNLGEGAPSEDVKQQPDG